ncbi:MAG: nucleotidyl transferase AbiEii/AbiGii toxin family protein [Chitinophagales bacterium]|nr:nucleotidyl transferase AbiEii/AbiGii toxin family protein [Chitinophagales bacterium]
MLHLNTVSPALRALVGKVAELDYFSPFRLCEGTALALQLGHRLSVDADFVSENEFDKETLAAKVASLLPDVTDVYVGELGVFLKSAGIKVDFLSWNTPFIRSAVKEEKLQLVHVEEIAAMKLFAITQRGEKKDYYDIAVLLQHYSLEKLLGFYSERHPKNDVSVVVRFLVSYSDIEAQPDPVTLVPLTWNNAKQLMKKSVDDFIGR